MPVLKPGSLIIYSSILIVTPCLEQTSRVTVVTGNVGKVSAMWGEAVETHGHKSTGLTSISSIHIVWTV